LQKKYNIFLYYLKGGNMETRAKNLIKVGGILLMAVGGIGIVLTAIGLIAGGDFADKLG